ncbi:hypothetical protein BV20DRAFT_665116 [Pilatotrama ljubarskyi]|nr:hypothetical protein BV20DRAFT_665116 [Pilatotrama ljubarskyi]
MHGILLMGDMSNSKGQSPCLVTSYLLAPCLSQTGSFIAALLPGRHYPIAHNSSADACTCNTVFNSTLFACDMCQLGPSADITPWSVYKEGCSVGVSIGLYPKAIPSTTEVPGWATLDVTVNDTFDAVAAEAQALGDKGSPTSSVSASASGSSVGEPQSSSSTHSLTTTATETPHPSKGNDAGNNSSSPAPSKKSSPAGAIAGGVVGSVVAITAIGAVTLWARRRRIRGRYAAAGSADATAHEDGQWAEKPTETGTSSLPTIHYTSLRLYDPDDPSTYPTNVLAAEMGLESHPTTSYPQVDPVSIAPSASLRADSPAGAYEAGGVTNPNAMYRGAPEL